MKKRLIPALVPLFAAGGVSFTLVGSNASEACASDVKAACGGSFAVCGPHPKEGEPHPGYVDLAEE